MYVVDNATMRRIDARSIESGVEGYDLMESAGEGAASRMLRRWRRGQWPEGTALILCGKGNNGGDGLVVARHLHRARHDVLALLVDAELEGEAAEALQHARSAGVPLLELGSDPVAALLEAHEQSPGVILVDALLGTGLRLPLRSPYAELVETMARLPRRIVALDCPSGVDGNDGQHDPRTATAEWTLAFGAPKWGTLLAPARALCGRIDVVPLDFPEAIVEAETAAADSTALYVDRRRVRNWLPSRAIDAHKYSAGSLLAVGASAGMSGAMALAVRAATRAGGGLVEAVVPRDQHATVDGACLEALIHAGDQTDAGGLSSLLLPFLRERAAKRSAVLVGPGAGDDLATAEMLADWLSELDRPTVVDADALGAAVRCGREPEFPSTSILTPHSGELLRLTGESAEALETDRRRVVVETARRFDAVVLHKGAPTFVADPTGRLAVVGAGGPGLATAGSGDVLAGTLAALLASGMPAFEAACAGAWLHGRAGDRAERRWGVHGVSALDLIDGVARVRADLEKWRV